MLIESPYFNLSSKQDMIDDLIINFKTSCGLQIKKNTVLHHCGPLLIGDGFLLYYRVNHVLHAYYVMDDYS